MKHIYDGKLQSLGKAKDAKDAISQIAKHYPNSNLEIKRIKHNGEKSVSVLVLTSKFHIRYIYKISEARRGVLVQAVGAKGKF